MTTSFAHDNRDLAELYDRISDVQLAGGQRLVERLGVSAGARVLDVGCGTGRLVAWIAECVGPTGMVAGIDPLAERIEIARSRTGGGDGGGGGVVTFAVGQAEDLGAFADASFDVVCMSSVLHWIDDKARALGEIRRVLRPGGRVGATTLPQELAAAGTLGRVLAPLVARAPYAGRVDFSALTFGGRGCTTTDLVSLIVDRGLELVELHVMQRNRTHASGEAVVDFLAASSFGNFLRSVPDDLRSAFRADLIAALDAEAAPDGVTMRGWGLLVIATRA
jgi:ubiquinone/menaquinone biosynthesis C-methylase UbiE